MHVLCVQSICQLELASCMHFYVQSTDVTAHAREVAARARAVQARFMCAYSMVRKQVSSIVTINFPKTLTILFIL